MHLLLAPGLHLGFDRFVDGDLVLLVDLPLALAHAPHDGSAVGPAP